MYSFLLTVNQKQYALGVFLKLMLILDKWCQHEYIYGRPQINTCHITL